MSYYTTVVGRLTNNEARNCIIGHLLGRSSSFVKLLGCTYFLLLYAVVQCMLLYPSFKQGLTVVSLPRSTESYQVYSYLGAME